MHRGSSGVEVGVRSESEGRRDGLAGMPVGLRRKSTDAFRRALFDSSSDVARVVFGVR
jgi:hypothetical protein